MKDLAKTYAPIVALLVGALVYWVYGQVSNLREINALLFERNTQLELALANQCTTILETQGFEVVLAEPPEPADGPSPDLEEQDGEDSR